MKKLRTENVSILTEVIERVGAADFCFVLNYGNLKVAQFTALRQELTKHDSRVLVVKNTYLAKTAQDLGWADISAILAGPTAIITGTGDVAEVAKALTEFVKKHDKTAVKGANVEQAILSAADVEALSKLPSKDVMRSILLSTMLAPATSFVRVLNAPLLNVLYALKAYEDKKGGNEEESAAEAVS